jgi:Tol biopolymer transport system component
MRIIPITVAVAQLLSGVWSDGVSAAEPPAKPKYQVAFASFAPLNFDVYLADADGSNARPLLPHPAQDYNASFSPDGRWILFTSTRGGAVANLYRVRTDGTGLERLTDGAAFDDQAVLSPDGKTVAFVSDRSGQADIWLLDLETRKLRNLTDCPGGDFRPAWSPDGKWLAFSSERDSPNDAPRLASIGRRTPHTAIFIMRADGTELRRLTDPRFVAGSPCWSPDGKRLAFYETTLEEADKIVRVSRPGATTQIATVEVATGKHQVVTTGKGEKWSPRWLSEERIAYTGGGPDWGLAFTDGKGSTAGEFRVPAWSADGKQMLFHRDVGSTWPPHQELPSLDPEFALVRTGIFPSYAPSGDRLVCNTERGAALRNGLLVMKADGSSRSVIFRDPEKNALAPVWSPNGDRIAFALGEARAFIPFQPAHAAAHLAVIDPDGKNLRVLTEGSRNDGFPSWSPDGRRLVYRTTEKLGAEKMIKGLRIIDVETRKVEALTDGVFNDNFPAWSPDGKRIAFTSDRDGPSNIYTIEPDGKGLRRLTKTGRDAHLCWSPDGKWIIFTSDRAGHRDELLLSGIAGQVAGDLYAIPSDGSEKDVRRLTNDQWEEGTPAVVPQRRP